MPERPPFLRYYTELENDGGGSYPGSEEQLSIGTPLSRPLGLTRLGIHHERIPPGHRTSWPHAESTEEEFVYVLEGTPDTWIDGFLHRLGPGDAVAFVPGTGLAHTFINNTDEAVRLLVVGEHLPHNKCYYPLQPEGWEGMAEERKWRDAPVRPLGPHDGLSDVLRKKGQ